MDPDAPLIIANSDQWVDHDINAHLAQLRRHDLDGLIMTMTADDPKWSFVELDGDRVTNVVEKEVVSSEATVGIYTFARAREYFDGARAMIAADKRVNGEFYVAPVYNELIAGGARIGIDNVGVDGGGMYGLGTPVDYESSCACRSRTAPRASASPPRRRRAEPETAHWRARGDVLSRGWAYRPSG